MPSFLLPLAVVAAGLLAGPAALASPAPSVFDENEADDEEMSLAEGRDSLSRGNPVVTVALMTRLTARNPQNAAAWQLLSAAHDALEVGLPPTAPAATAPAQEAPGTLAEP